LELGQGATEVAVVLAVGLPRQRLGGFAAPWGKMASGHFSEVKNELTPFFSIFLTCPSFFPSR
jgi:hypothetical protein